MFSGHARDAARFTSTTDRRQDARPHHSTPQMKRPVHIRPDVPRRLFLAILASLVALAGIAEASRSVLPLDDGWRFHLGEAPDAVSLSFDDSAWRVVDVPHDYVVEEAFTEKNPEPRAEALRGDWYWLHGFLPTRPAVYRKTFTLPAGTAGRRLWLEFDGVFSNSFTWLNG
ncbi:MAG: hypothetical protein IAE82_20870, partial [Opitutaceae bacterium]|nr:hypothetical protein [Opitutaceae bacterium]